MKIGADDHIIAKSVQAEYDAVEFGCSLPKRRSTVRAAVAAVKLAALSLFLIALLAAVIKGAWVIVDAFLGV